MQTEKISQGPQPRFAIGISVRDDVTDASTFDLALTPRTVTNKKPTMPTAQAHQKALLDKLQAMSGRKSLYEVWFDFVTCFAIAIANQHDLRPEVRAAREDEYLKTVGRYSRDDVLAISECCAHAAMAMQLSGYEDVLGRAYMEMGLGNKWAGQFFTPDSVCQLMAGITMDRAHMRRCVTERGFLTASDPAIGAGAMVIALASQLAQEGFDPGRHLHVTGQDIDRKAVLMSYVQLSLVGVPAALIVGNTLTMEAREVWYTPAHIHGGWSRKLGLLTANPALRSQAHARPAQPGEEEVGNEADLPLPTLRAA